ncbi:MAG: IS200/IS605 family transposase [Chloroflexota bacterium]|nr:IS200/IS605 family transposase [Chloroflexota bacterium]
MAHWRLFYHLVWSTRDREPFLSTQVAVETVGRSFVVICNDLHVIVHAIGIMPDHIHLACSIPPSLSIADAVKRLKGASSHRLNQVAFGGDTIFAWQAEYGVYSFTERVLPEVVAYVPNQESRHAAANLWSGYEQMRSLGTTKDHARRGN